MIEENNLHIVKPDNWAYITQLIRQNPQYLEVLNEINARFDKPIFLDDKDWLQGIFSTLFNFIWQSDEGSGVIISHHAFSEPNLARGSDGEKLRVYFYTLPEVKNDKLKETYEIAMGKLFPKYTTIEGVQINGSNHTQTTVKSNGKSTATNKHIVSKESTATSVITKNNTTEK